MNSVFINILLFACLHTHFIEWILQNIYGHKAYTFFKFKYLINYESVNIDICAKISQNLS